MTEVKYEEGLTSRSFLALAYSSLVLMPAVMFGYLVANVSLVGYLGVGQIPILGYAVAYLFRELARLSGTRLTKQEVFVIYSASITAAGEIFFFTVMHNAYYRSLSPLTWSFFAPGSNIPLPLEIPDWFAPPPYSSAILSRSFLHSGWIMPVLTFSVGTWLMTKVIALATGTFTYQLYVVEEKLPFPIQKVGAESILTLSEREPSKMNILTLCALISSLYGLVLYFIPFITFFGFVPIPIPWVDFNAPLHTVIQGASFGISTDLLYLAAGMMLPLHVSISIFVGSIALFFFGNYYLVTNGISGFAKEYSAGMNISQIWQRSTLHVWAFVSIGLSVAAAIIPLIVRPGAIMRAVKSLSKVSETFRERGVLPIHIILALYLAGAGALVALCYSLAPNFPIWILAAMVFGWIFLGDLISSNALGTSGFTVSIPYMQQFIVSSSGYQGVDAWYLPLNIGGWGTWWCGWFKMCDLSKTKLSSYIKANLISTPMAFALSFVYMSLFWVISPIPSPLYPAVDIYFPITVLMGYQTASGTLWVSRAVAAENSMMWLLGSLGIGTAIQLLITFVHLPFSLMGAVVGTLLPIPITLMTLVGGLLNWFLKRKFGKAVWEDYQPVVCAGLFLGESLIITLGVLAAMIMKGMWLLPY